MVKRYRRMLKKHKVKIQGVMNNHFNLNQRVKSGKSNKKLQNVSKDQAKWLNQAGNKPETKMIRQQPSQHVRPNSAD